MKSRLPLETLSIYAFLALLGLFIADISLLFVRGGMYPQPPPPAQRAPPSYQVAGGGNASAITSRNIFNSDGKIAPPLGQAGEAQPTKNGCEDPNAEPTPSSIQVQLLGTIVHANPKRSVASIAVKSKNDQIAVKIGQTIPDSTQEVRLIQRNKVILCNTTGMRKEFIELKDDSKIAFGAAAIKPQQVGEVMVKSETEREMKRSDIDRLTSNLPELLQQARAVPRMGPGGQIECFSLADIAPGSIYERLGLQRGDCIKSVNGERIDSPAKAMELYNALRANSNAINLGIERGGRDTNMNYNITQ